MRALDTDVYGFYWTLGVRLPDRGPSDTRWAPIRCFLAGHEDRHKSASVNVDSGGWRCHACNRKGGPWAAALERGYSRSEAAKILKAHGLWRDDFETPPRRPQLADTTMPAPRPPDIPDPERTTFDWARSAPTPPGRRTEYEYVDENNQPVHRTVRIDTDGQPKKFWQEHWADGWQPGLEGVRRLVLYRLPAVQQHAKAGGRVYVVEGEKAVHAVERLGLVATCSPMGAGKWKPLYATMLTGANVVPIPDCDTPGREHMLDVLETCVRANINVVEPLELGLHHPAGYDIVDLLKELADTMRAVHPDLDTINIRRRLQQWLERFAGRCLRPNLHSAKRIRARWAAYQKLRDEVARGPPIPALHHLGQPTPRRAETPRYGVTEKDGPRITSNNGRSNWKISNRRRRKLEIG